MVLEVPLAIANEAPPPGKPLAAMLFCRVNTAPLPDEVAIVLVAIVWLVAWSTKV